MYYGKREEMSGLSDVHEACDPYDRRGGLFGVYLAGSCTSCDGSDESASGSLWISFYGT